MKEEVAEVTTNTTKRDRKNRYLGMIELIWSRERLRRTVNETAKTAWGLHTDEDITVISSQGRSTKTILVKF